MSQTEKDLEPIDDKKVIDRYLRYVVDLNEPLVCLLDSGQVCFEAAPKSADGRTLTIMAEINGENFASMSTEELNRIDSNPTLRLSFSVQDVLFFAHAKIKDRIGPTVQLVFDKPIFKLQRRNAIRIKVMKDHGASITVEGKTYYPHDLSATGVSFVVMLEDEALYPLQRMIQSCHLKFAGLDVPVNLEVTSKSLLKKGGERLVKIGFRFLGLSPATEQRIAKEAYLHTHKIWSRWL